MRAYLLSIVTLLLAVQPLIADPCVQTGGSTQLANAAANLDYGEACEFASTGLSTALYGPNEPVYLTLYANSAPWNPIANQIQMIAKGYAPSTRPDNEHHWITYDEATNAWAKTRTGLPVELTTECPSAVMHCRGGTNPGAVCTGDQDCTGGGTCSLDNCQGHMYDGSTVDPATGTFYFGPQYGVSQDNTAVLWKRSVGGTWTKLWGASKDQVDAALAWADDGLRHFYFHAQAAKQQSSTDGMTWVSETPVPLPGSTGNNEVIEYDPITNTTMMGGGGTFVLPTCNQNRAVFVRDEATDITTRKADAPYNYGIAHSSSCPRGRVTYDPVNGGFFVMLDLYDENPGGPGDDARTANDQYQHYNPVDDTWAVYTSAPPPDTIFKSTGFVSTIGEYGVIAIVDGAAYTVTLYKPSLLVTACSDGVDNDSDGYTDYPSDLGCTSSSDVSERDSAQCDDGIDNDSDGSIDTQDADCTGPDDTTEYPVLCSNGLDDDGDGNTDFPADPGCSNALDPDERGPGDVECSDGIDNDGDRKFDTGPALRCAGGTEAWKPCKVDGDCGGGGTCTLDGPGSGCGPGETFDIGFHTFYDADTGPLGQSNCYAIDPDCNPDDAKNDNTEDIAEHDGLCSGGANDGQVCVLGGSFCGAGTCVALPDCNDGRDNDGDRACDYAGCTINSIGYPPDPGCSDANDTNEHTDADEGNVDPGGIKACDDGEDNDGDSFEDYQAGLCKYYTTPPGPGPYNKWPCGRFAIQPGMDNYDCGGTCVNAPETPCITDSQCPGSVCSYVCGKSPNECDDGIDNDGDELTDFPADTSCIAWNGISESNSTIRQYDDAYDVNNWHDMNCEEWTDNDESGIWDGLAEGTDECDYWDWAGDGNQQQWDTRGETCRSQGYVSGTLLCGPMFQRNGAEDHHLNTWDCVNDGREVIDAATTVRSGNLIGFTGDDNTSSITGLPLGAWRAYDLNTTRKAQAANYLHVVCEGYGGTTGDCEIDSGYSPWSDANWAAQCTSAATSITGANVIYDLWDRPDQSRVLFSQDNLTDALHDCYTAIHAQSAGARMTAPSFSSVQQLAGYLFHAVEPQGLAQTFPGTGYTDIAGGIKAINPVVEPSGLVYHPGLDRLFVVHDGGKLYRINPTTGAVDWEVYPVGDYEGVTITSPDSQYVYVVIEGGPAQPTIVERNASDGGAGRVWSNLSDIVTVSGSGAESITFVPIPGDPEGGEFWLGSQYNGKIYRYRLSLSGGQTYTYLGEYPSPGGSDLSGLEYDWQTGVVYALIGQYRVSRINPATGAVIDSWATSELFPDVPTDDQEGIAVYGGRLWVANDGGATTPQYPFIGTWSWPVQTQYDAGAELLAASGYYDHTPYGTHSFLDYLEANPTFELSRLSLQFRDDENAPLWRAELAALQSAVAAVVNDGSHPNLLARWGADLPGLAWDVTAWGGTSSLLEPGHAVLALSGFAANGVDTAVRACANDPNTGTNWCTTTDNLNGLLASNGDKRPLWQTYAWYGAMASDEFLSTTSTFERMGTIATKNGDLGGSTIVQILTGFSTEDGGVLPNVDSLDDIKWLVVNPFFGFEYGDNNVVCDVLEGNQALYSDHGMWLIKRSPLRGAAPLESAFDLSTDCATGDYTTACHKQSLSTFVIANQAWITEADRDDDSCGIAGGLQFQYDYDGDGWYGTGEADNIYSGHAVGDPDPGCTEQSYTSSRDQYNNKRAEAQLYDGEVVYLKLQCFDEPEVPTDCNDVAATGLPCVYKDTSTALDDAISNQICGGLDIQDRCDRDPLYILYGPGNHVGDAHAPGSTRFRAFRMIGASTPPPKVYGTGTNVGGVPVYETKLTRFVQVYQDVGTDIWGGHASIRNFDVHHTADDIVGISNYLKPVNVEVRHTTLRWAGGRAITMSGETVQLDPLGSRLWVDHSSIHHVDGQHVCYLNRNNETIWTNNETWGQDNLNTVKFEGRNVLVLNSIFSNGNQAGTDWETGADAWVCNSGDNYGDLCDTDDDCPNALEGRKCQCDWRVDTAQCLVGGGFYGIAPIDTVTCHNMLFAGNTVRWITEDSSGGAVAFQQQNRRPIWGCDVPNQWPPPGANTVSDFWDSAWWAQVKAAGLGDMVDQADNPYASNTWIQDNTFIRFNKSGNPVKSWFMFDPTTYIENRQDPGAIAEYTEMRMPTPAASISRLGVYLLNNCFTLHPSSPDKFHPPYHVRYRPYQGSAPAGGGVAVPFTTFAPNTWWVGGQNLVDDGQGGCTGAEVAEPEWWAPQFDARAVAEGPSATCGNSILEGDEQCDTENLGGLECTDVGFDAGTLDCFPFGDPNQCSFDTSGCFSLLHGGTKGASHKGATIR